MTEKKRRGGAGGSKPATDRDRHYVQLVATLLKNKDGTMKKHPRVFEPKRGRLSIPSGGRLHGRPVVLIGQGEDVDVKAILWDDGIELRFADGVSKRLSFDELYLDAVADRARDFDG